MSTKHYKTRRDFFKTVAKGLAVLPLVGLAGKAIASVVPKTEEFNVGDYVQSRPIIGTEWPYDSPVWRITDKIQHKSGVVNYYLHTNDKRYFGNTITNERYIAEHWRKVPVDGSILYCDAAYNENGEIRQDVLQAIAGRTK